jgi:polyhydroxyalkanoate synthesis regulator phasin
MNELDQSMQDLVDSFVATGYSKDQATEMVKKMFGQVQQ